MTVFDIIGPTMIGPSSSHTAGAARIGCVARQILCDEPAEALIGLAGSFALTGKGHGTDKALVAGILGFQPDDERIRDSFDIAKEQGLSFSFKDICLPRAHPNTARIWLTGKSGKKCRVTGASVGGGNILITGVNEMDTGFTGEQDTLIVRHQDKPGVIAEVASMMAWDNINISNFKLNRPHRGFESVMTIEIDGKADAKLVEHLSGLPHVDGVVYIPALSQGVA
jgi:L-serine dehydratase